MGEAHGQQRLASEERKALLIDAAERTFAARGYTRTGLAEVAALAGVSKTLLYHYFPNGRPELYRLVMERLAGRALDAVAAAADGSGAPEDRLARLIAALIGHFRDHPDAYRLLVREPWGSGDPGIIGQAMAVRTRLAGTVNQLLTATAAEAPVIMAGGAAVVGAALHLCELALSDQLTDAQAVDTAHRFVRGGLVALDLL